MTASDARSGKPILAFLKRNKARFLLWGRVLVTVVLLGFVISLVARDTDKFTGVDWKLIPIAWLLSLVSMGVKAYRWSLLVRQSQLNISLPRLFGMYLVGTFFSTILPTSVGGDAVRVVDTAASTGRAADATSSVLIERGLGLLAVAAMGSIFALFLKAGQVPLAFVLVVHLMFIGGVVGIVVLRQGWFMGPLDSLLRTIKLRKIADKVMKLETALAGHLGSPRLLLNMFALSLVANMMTIGATYLVLVAVTDPISLAEFVPMIALCTVAELIPISIASLGVKESAYVFFLGLVDVGKAEAGMIAIIMRVLTWGLALLGGIIFLNRTIRARSQKEAA